MQETFFKAVYQVRDIQDLNKIEPKMGEIYQGCLSYLKNVDPRGLVIRGRVGKVSCSRKCVEASIVHAFKRTEVSPNLGMKLRYLMRDASKMAVDVEWNASEFDVGYYGKLLEKAWGEVAFVFKNFR